MKTSGWIRRLSGWPNWVASVVKGLVAKVRPAVKPAAAKRKKDLAATSGLTQAAIGHYVKGARVPNLETAIRISSALCKPIAARSMRALVGLAPGHLPHGARNVLSSDGHKAHAERNRDGGLHGG